MSNDLSKPGWCEELPLGLLEEKGDIKTIYFFHASKTKAEIMYSYSPGYAMIRGVVMGNFMGDNGGYHS